MFTRFRNDPDDVSERGANSGYGFDEFYSGERICPPGLPARSKNWLSAIIVIALAATGFAVVRTNPPLEDWLSAKLAELSSATAAGSTQQAAQSDAIQSAQPADAASADKQPELPTAVDVAAVPGQLTGTAAAQSEPPSAATETAESVTEKTENTEAPLPKPIVDPADPYQKRAAAVGLDPSLSRALLAKLSADDYRNAGIAIETALAKTPDSDSYVWPTRAKAKNALFEVKFVAGAPEDCRRYVVTVTKDRWSTTAHPMEKCGLPARALRLKAS